MQGKHAGKGRRGVSPPGAHGDLREGMILLRARLTCDVEADGGVWRCDLRGRLRAEGGEALVGDRVMFRELASGQGVIERVLPRRTVLSRQTGGRRAVRRLYCANVDTVVIVCAANEPPLRPALIDRLLITARYEGLDPVICLNKMDLDDSGDARAVIDLYRELGYETFTTCARSGEGGAALGERLRRGLSVFAGHSGVGKTTLLGVLVPGFTRKTREVGPRARGRHATTEVYMVRLPGGGLVVDTPGFREFSVWGLVPEDIGSYYPEFLPHISRCRFNNCLHLDEPGCAVMDAVAAGVVSALRYHNYLRLLQTHGR